MAGMFISLMVQTVLSSFAERPLYVAPCEVEMVSPKAGSEAWSVMTVSRYVCGLTVPVHPSLHSVPVP